MKSQLVMVAYTFNLRTQEAGESLLVPDQSDLHSSRTARVM